MSDATGGPVPADQASVKSVAVKLQALYDGLSPEEQSIMASILDQAALAATSSEVSGFQANVGIVINLGVTVNQYGGGRSCYIPVMSPGAFQSTLGRPAPEPAPYIPSLTYVDGIAYGP